VLSAGRPADKSHEPEAPGERLANYWHGEFPWRPADGYGTRTPAGTFAPNGFGLYDMQGNVWEWVQDCWQDNYAHAPRDGSPLLSGDCQRRVVRGAAFNRDPSFMRSATRYWIVGQLRSALAGFRVAMTLS